MFTFHSHAFGEGNDNPLQWEWRIPGTSEPGGLLSMGLHRVGHDWSDLEAAAAALCAKIAIIWKKKSVKN